jgi:hypothetical protein
MVSWYDSYDGAWHDIGDGAADPILIFSRDGHFVEDMVGGCCRRTGDWTLVDGRSKLILSYTDGSNRDLEYQVQRLDPDELQLAWPGVHGPVINKYIPR